MKPKFYFRKDKSYEFSYFLKESVKLKFRFKFKESVLKCSFDNDIDTDDDEVNVSISKNREDLFSALNDIKTNTQSEQESS